MELRVGRVFGFEGKWGFSVGVKLDKLSYVLSRIILINSTFCHFRLLLPHGKTQNLIICPWLSINLVQTSVDLVSSRLFLSRYLARIFEGKKARVRELKVNE